MRPADPGISPEVLDDLLADAVARLDVVAAVSAAALLDPDACAPEVALEAAVKMTDRVARNLRRLRESR